jgi:hypothetical protein
MEIKSNLCANATRKVALLITKASDLGMDIGGFGFADENPHSGNVYLWLEDYSFTLFIGLGQDDIYAVWTNQENGDEHEIEIQGKTLRELEDWAESLYNEMQEA